MAVEEHASKTGMAWVPGGSFAMGSETFYPEERPVHDVEVDGFWIDRHAVTVSEFRRFVTETGYVTVAERPLDAAQYPDADSDLLVPGSLVFLKTHGPVDLRDFHNWWQYVPGANWQHPEGPGSTVAGRHRHPVTHVAPEDAQAYAAWAGKALPTEAEWEFAARGGLDGAIFAWGNEFAPRGRLMANTWQGEFPWQNLRSDGYEGTSPVGSFDPNGYGLYDMTGNVWEWTADFFALRHADAIANSCCTPRNPTRPITAGRRGDPAARDQGRLAPVRARLLPALPPRCSPGRGRRHVDGAHRLSLCRARRGLVPAADSFDVPFTGA